MNKLFILIISLLIAILKISCDIDDDSNLDCQNVVCTQQFVSISVTIIDQNENPVALDSFEVISIENGTDMTISLSPSELQMAHQVGQYPLVNDLGVEINQELELQFKGVINNQEVINSNFTVGKGCCHVGLASGNLQIVL